MAFPQELDSTVMVLSILRHQLSEELFISFATEAD